MGDSCSTGLGRGLDEGYCSVQYMATYCRVQYSPREGAGTMSTPTIDTDRLIWSFHMLMDVKDTAEERGGALSVIDSRLRAAATPPLHVHHTADEAFFVLEGEVEFFLDGAEPRRAGPGDFVFGPRGVPHRFEVRSPEARVLVLGTPGGGDQFF